MTLLGKARHCVGVLALSNSNVAWCRWTSDAVARAYERAKSVKPMLATTDAKQNPGGVRLTRREFWDVFTDYTVLHGDSWLSLPLYVFSMFDNTDSGTIDVLEVFLMVALFSEGEMEDQLRFCFKVFDTDHSGSITIDEMLHFFQVLCRASFKVLAAAVPACLRGT